jgi:ferredoxin
VDALTRHSPSSRTVTVLPAGVEIAVPVSECIVDGLRRSGWRLAYKCRRGGCGACKVRLVAGTVRYEHSVAESVLSRADVENGGCLPCRAIPVTDVVLDLGERGLRPVLASNSPQPTDTASCPPMEARSTCQS